MKFRDSELIGLRNKAIPQWIDKVLEEDFDRVILVVGVEGVGKSTLAILLGHLITEARNKKMGIDRPFQIETNISYDLKKLKRQVFKDSVSGDVRIIDESAITGGYRREAMGKMNRLLNKTLMTCRSRNQILLFLIPSINAVESYIRERCHSIIRVVDRGHAWVYGANEKGKVSWDRKKKKVVFRERAKYHLERYRSVQDILGKEEWDRYVKHKEDSLSEEYDEREDLVDDKEISYVYPKVLMKRYQISRRTVVKGCEEGVKHFRTKANQRKIDEADFKRWYILNG